MIIKGKPKDQTDQYRPRVKKHEENHGQRILDKLTKKKRKWWWRAK